MLLGTEKQVEWAKELLKKEYERLENYPDNCVSKSIIKSFFLNYEGKEKDAVLKIKETERSKRDKLIEKYGEVVTKERFKGNIEVIEYFESAKKAKKAIIDLEKQAYKKYLDSFEMASKVIDRFFYLYIQDK